jgi:hypothetical protein
MGVVWQEPRRCNSRVMGVVWQEPRQRHAGHGARVAGRPDEERVRVPTHHHRLRGREGGSTSLSSALVGTINASA